MSKELEMIITSTKDGVFLTYTPKTNGRYSGEGFINRRFDGVEITITHQGQIHSSNVTQEEET